MSLTKLSDFVFRYYYILVHTSVLANPEDSNSIIPKTTAPVKPKLVLSIAEGSRPVRLIPPKTADLRY